MLTWPKKLLEGIPQDRTVNAGLYRTKFLADFDQAVLTRGLCRNKEQATLTISFAPNELLWPEQLLPYPEREPRKMPFLRALRSKLWHDIRKGLRQLAFSFPLWLGPRRHNYANWRHLFTAFRAIKPWDCVECLRLSNLQPAIPQNIGAFRCQKKTFWAPKSFFSGAQKSFFFDIWKKTFRGPKSFFLTSGFRKL